MKEPASIKTISNCRWGACVVEQYNYKQRQKGGNVERSVFLREAKRGRESKVVAGKQSRCWKEKPASIVSRQLE